MRVAFFPYWVYHLPKGKPTQPTKQMANTFFETFFAEKDLTEQIYEIEMLGSLHLIPTESVIEKIKTTQGEEAKQIENILRQIDFKNGDVHHFLRHLATAMAAQF